MQVPRNLALGYRVPFQVVVNFNGVLVKTRLPSYHPAPRRTTKNNYEPFGYALELSGGEQQRVQLARVLAQVWSPVINGSAKWIFLDEPVSSLDISFQLEVMNLMQNYANKGGGVFTIMHDLNLTAMYADYVGVLHNGKLLCFGTPSEVINDKILSEAYSCRIKVNITPQNDKIFILPQATKI